MNPITSVQKIYNSVPPQIRELLEKEKFEFSPVYVDDDVESSERKESLIESRDPEILNVSTVKTEKGDFFSLPFDSLRVFIPEGRLPAFWHFVSSTPGRLFVFTYMDSQNPYWEIRRGKIHFIDEGAEFETNFSAMGISKEWKIIVNGGKMVNPDELFEQNTSRFIPYVGTVAYRFKVPSLHTATVSPNPSGRSVEWLKKRTRIVLLHKNFSMNKKGRFPGSTEDERSSENVSRVSHARRSYTKLLTHPRFKKMKGKRVFVKSTWVGPKEWKDLSGQVYKIVS